jgi:hypothetical protein
MVSIRLFSLAIRGQLAKRTESYGKEEKTLTTNRLQERSLCIALSRTGTS